MACNSRAYCKHGSRAVQVSLASRTSVERGLFMLVMLAIASTRALGQCFFSDFSDVKTGKGFFDFVAYTAEFRIDEFWCTCSM